MWRETLHTRLDSRLLQNVALACAQCVLSLAPRRPVLLYDVTPYFARAVPRSSSLPRDDYDTDVDADFFRLFGGNMHFLRYGNYPVPEQRSIWGFFGFVRRVWSCFSSSHYVTNEVTLEAAHYTIISTADTVCFRFYSSDVKFALRAVEETPGSHIVPGSAVFRETEHGVLVSTGS